MTPKLFKAAEVCESTGVQPYVLRSWEKEFPGIGVQKSAEAPRLYRQSDVDHVLRIKQLVFGEGLTLAGARRRLEETTPPPAVKQARAAEIAEVLDTLGADVRKRIALVRSGLQAILNVLAKDPGAAQFAPVRVMPSSNGDRSRAATSAKAVSRARKRAAPARPAPRAARKPAGKSAGKGKRRSAARA